MKKMKSRKISRGKAVVEALRKSAVFELLRKNEIFELLRKSAGAAVLIGLGDYVLLRAGNPVGPVLFAFGLLGVCVLGLNLFTGKCGFLFEDKIKVVDLLLILGGNLAVGYVFGRVLGLADGAVVEAARGKVLSWELSWAFLIRAGLCGMIMYLAVKLYKKGTKLGILLGVPLFIFSGMQHSIANIITLGASFEMNLWVLECVGLCVVGNFLGAILAWAVTGGRK